MTLQPIVFAFTGSSLTTGRLSADWVPRLKARLEQEPEAKGRIVVYNMGKGSQTSDWGVTNAPELSHLKPTHILFEGFAINDCAIGPVTLPQSATNFGLMVSEWRTNIPGVSLTHQTMSPASAADANRTLLPAYYNQELVLASAAGIPSLDHTPAWPAITDANTFGAAGMKYTPPTGFAVWGGLLNAADKDASLTLGTNARTVSSASAGEAVVRGTQSRSSGKWYFEVATTGVFGSSNSTNDVGIAKSGHTLTAYLGSAATGYGLRNGNVFNSSVGGSAAVMAQVGQRLMVAVDFTALKIWYGVEGVWSGDPVAGTGGEAITAGTYFPAWSGATSDAASFYLDTTVYGGDQLHPIWTGVFETYSYPSILAWAKAKMAVFWP